LSRMLNRLATLGIARRFIAERGSQGMRERILFAMILIGTLFSAITFIPGALLTLREGLWPVFAMNTAVLTCGFLLLAVRRLGYRIRAWAACMLIYAVGAYVVFFFGFLSGGPIWLFSFGVMCGLLLGVRAAVIGIGVNASTLLVFVWLHAVTPLGQGLPFFSSWLHCLTAFGGFVLMNAVAAVSCSLVLQDEEAISLSLRREKSQILEAKTRLEEEVISRKEAEKQQRELARELEFLHDTAMEFVSERNEEDLYGIIAKRIREILGDVFVLVNAYEPKTKEFRTLAIEGVGPNMERVLNILGRNQLGMVTTLNDEEAERKLKTGKISKGPQDLHELSFGAVAKSIGHAIERFLNIRRIYAIGLVTEGELFGSAIIVDRSTPSGADFVFRKRLVEAYVNQASLALLRNRFERELKESEERYRQLVNNAPAGIYEMDLKNFGITNVNEVMCRYTGYTKEEFLSLNPLILLAEESLEKFIERGRRIFAGQPISESTEYKIRRKDGSTFWVRSHSKATYTHGVAVKNTLVLHDITEVKTLEEEKRQLQESLLEARKMEAIATLAGGIAHQFNNALSVVSVSTDMLDLCREVGEEHQKYTNMVRESIQRMTGLTSQLLAYAGGGKYYARTLSLSLFVSETLPTLLPEMPASVQVETDLSQDVLPVKVDPKQMKSVLSAILTNAVEAMEEGGKIRIACTNQAVEEGDLKEYPDLVPGPYTALTIEDNGKGMDERTLKKIFDPFFTTKFQGRGLAMPAVLGIVKNHGGWIGVDSENGKGTTVRILLPVFEEHTEAWGEERGAK